jgi:hypothetical protein
MVMVELEPFEARGLPRMTLAHLEISEERGHLTTCVLLMIVRDRFA